MIGIPFILWLIFTSLEFGNNEQVFALLGITGFILNFTKYSKLIWGNALSFILMIIPLTKRLIETPIEKFNYLSFQIPLMVFIITYMIFVLYSKKEDVKDT